MKWLGSLAVAGLVVSAVLPASAQTCTPLRVVAGKGTQIEKKVSIPGTPTSRSNWNTDFAVPSGQGFNRFVATIVPLNGGNYTVQMFLKYPNATADKVYDQTVALQNRRPVQISGSPRLNARPYQINLSVGGVPVVGDTYRASVLGCR